MLATPSGSTSTPDGDAVATADPTLEPSPAAPPDDPPGTSDGAGGRGPLRRGVTWLTVLVVVLAVVAAALAVAWQRSSDEADRLRQQQQLRSSALTAAHAYAVDLTTYDHASLAAQQAKLAAESTQRFQDTFADSMKTLGPIFEQLEATATGTVVDAAVVSATTAKATVILFVDQEASSKETKKPETQASRIVMHLVRQQGRWLLDRVDLV